ncbi:MAG: Bro-N domain-containing protein [Bacteroidales bacterium]|nr:Bro-N domain-containing protein [Bacteroidales bacterium]
MEKVQIFQDKKVRTHWDGEKEEWYFSVVDVVGVLTDSINPTDYLKKMRKRDPELAAFMGTNCPQVEMMTETGKRRKTLAADSKAVFRIIQSIPSPKAEPFKQWLAQVGTERLDEIADPEKAIVRGADFYRAKGYNEGWTNQRLQSIEMRKELTDEWKARGIDQERDYAILTNEMTRAWSGLTVRDYKEVKGLKKENLRNNMTNLEFVLNMLAEVTTTAISRSRQPESFAESRSIAIEGGNVAGSARREIEQRTGQPVVSPLNATDKLALDTNIEDVKQIEPSDSPE